MIGCLGINFFGQQMKKPSRVQRKRAGKKVLIRGHAAMCYLLCCVVPGSFPNKRFSTIILSNFLNVETIPNGKRGFNFFRQCMTKPSRVQRKRVEKKVLIRGHAAMCYLLCCVVPGSFPDKLFYTITLYKTF